MAKKSKTKQPKPSKKVPGWIYWTPRIASILFIVFLALFSLDVFGQGYGFWGTILAFFMHNIPVIILAILLWIAWKREIVGAITFFIAGLFYLVFIQANMVKTGFEWYYLAWAVQIAGPAFFIGILFWIGWRNKAR